MKHYLDILKKNKLLITVYVLLGIVLAWLNAFSANYFKKLLDGFGDKTLSITTISIYVDRNDLSELNLNYFYNYISYTSQESPIFDGTLRENIIFDKDISDDTIIEVLERVGLTSFYSELPKGLHTEVGERGVMLSGGERQRLALARVFFGDAKIVILDEATSAMDNVTEELVMKNMMQFLKNKTIITIAHRLNTIKNVDKIYAFKDGRIVGEGGFKELLEHNQYFGQLWNATIKN